MPILLTASTRSLAPHLVEKCNTDSGLEGRAEIEVGEQGVGGDQRRPKAEDLERVRHVCFGNITLVTSG